MRSLTILTAALVVFAAGCAGEKTSNPGDPMAVEQGKSKGEVIQEAVRVPSSEVRPEDPPAEPLEPVEPLPTAEAVDAMYRIGATDVLGFRSFDDETINSTVVVRHDGMISLPWIPDVRVGGLTREAATEVVREAYQELYYEAEVSLQIIDATSKTFTVTGDVNRAAEYPYLKPLTLLDAIIAAGGLRVNQRGGDSFVGGQGQLVKAFIIRGEGEERLVTSYDLRNLEKSGAHNAQTPVLPGDIIYIPEGINLVYVLGAVGRPGIQPLSEGMTLLQLLAASGGVNESIGRMKQLVLIREIDDAQTEVQLIDLTAMLKQGADMLMQPGDVVYVPRKRLVTLGEFIGRATGLVTPIMGVTSQAMGLYTQAFDVYYADDRADLLYRSNQSNQLQTNLQLLEAIRQVGRAAEGF
ncbi:MAG: SLBB domain-containing protein [Candidatus Hydrogenedentes bacterium]|nr:SLBB domain-containing protein [Candidatus Hydrogenedentota bacterium]